MKMMANNPTSVRALALTVLGRMRDSAWDSAGTERKKLSQGRVRAGTAKAESAQRVNPIVPLSAKKRDTGWDSSGTVLLGAVR